MMLYKNSKVIICLPDGGTKLFEFFAGVLEGDNINTYVCIIHRYYELQTTIDLLEENGFNI